ncbi:MAG: ribosome maturation factor RimM [Gemmatimonadota bacterium]|nr:ribosome maturation factor RimM [Gemmatimonadota bacterium]
MTTRDDLVIVGRVRRPHGVRGELFIEVITDEPDAVYASGRRVFAGSDRDTADDTTVLTVIETRPFKEGLLIRFEEILDRTAAERWNGRLLFVPEHELTPPGEGEVYLHELQGMMVELSSGEVVGTVANVFEVPQGLLLDVARERGTVLVPFTDEVIVDIDRDRRVVRIDPPEGLLE